MTLQISRPPHGKWDNSAGAADYLHLVGQGGAIVGGIDSSGVLLTQISGSVNPQSAPYNAKFDARWTSDGVLTSGSPIVTSATIIFAQGDVGKKIYTINSANGLTRLNGTILSVQSPTSAVASVNATATESGSGLVVGTDDTTALVAAWNSALVTNKLLLLPSGATIVSSQLFAAAGPSFPRGTNFSVQGSGPGTILIVSPDFNFAGCTVGSGGCIYGVSTQQFVFPDGIHSWPQVGNFTVTGLASIYSGSAGNISLFTVGSGGGAVWHDIIVANYCSVQANMSLFTLNQEDRAYNLNLQGNGCVNTNVQPNPISIGTSAAIEIFAPIIAYMGSRAMTFTNSSDVTIHGGLLVSMGGNTGSNPHSYIGLINSTNIRFIGTRITNPSSSVDGWDIDATSNLLLDGVNCVNSAAATSSCVNNHAGGVVKIGRYSQLNSSGGATSITNAGTVHDDGTNIFGTAGAGIGATYGFGTLGVAFANLGTPINGTSAFCTDCTIANPCASGGSGAFAKRLNGVWVCN